MSAWKWVLNVADDSLLVSTAKSCQVRIAGFRGSNWEKNLALLRPRVVQELLTVENLPKLGPSVDAQLKDDAEAQAIRKLSEEQLLQQVPQQITPVRALLALLSSSEPEVAAVGEALYQQWQENGVLENWLQLRQEAQAEIAANDRLQTELENCQEQIKQLTRQLRKMETKVNKLTAELSQQVSSAQQEQKKWQTEVGKLQAQLASLTTEMNEQHNRLLQQGAVIRRQEVEWERLVAAVAQAEQLQIQEEQPSPVPDEAEEPPAEPKEATADNREAQNLPDDRRLQVAVVGNLQQSNMPLPAPDDVELQHVSLSMLQQKQTQQLFAWADQVWMLTYAVPLPLQRYLRRIVPAEKLLSFATYEEFMNNLGQGV